MFAVDDIEKQTERSSHEVYLSSDTLHMLQKRNLDQAAGAGDASSNTLCDEKLLKIMTYLDEVDTAERLTEIDEVAATTAQTKIMYGQD